MNATDYAENKIIDWIRGQGLTLPTNWFFALASAADDTGITELSGTGYARQAVLRGLAGFLDTQGAGGGVASSGTTHATSNVSAISWGNPAASWGTANFIGIMDASTGGNCWFWVAISPITITTGSPNPVQVAAGALQLVFGLLSGCTDALANKLVDLIFRAQAFSWPGTLYVGLFTATPNNAGGGTEVSGGSYARAALVPSLTALSQTSVPGGTAASSGIDGRTSNNAAVVLPAPTASWGTVIAWAIFDAATAGTMLLYAALASPKTVASGGPAPTFAPNTLGITVG